MRKRCSLHASKYGRLLVRGKLPTCTPPQRRARISHDKQPDSCGCGRALVDELVEQMGLSHVMDTKVGGYDVVGCEFLADGMSGGERKTLQVASHLLRQPRSIVLDEPTTGARGLC